MQERDVIIKAEKVADWRRRLADLDKERETFLAKVDKEREALIAKLEIVEEMTQDGMLEEEDLDVSGDHQGTNGHKYRGKVAMVVNVLSSNPTVPMTPAEIREQLILSGVNPEDWGAGFAYVYSVLKRLKDSGRIRETGDGYTISAGELLTRGLPPAKK